MKAYEEIKKLETALEADLDLRERYREKVESLAKENSALRPSELAAMAASQIGYDLPVNLFETAARMEAVSDDEIEAVSGGRSVNTGRAFDLNAWIGSLLRGMLAADCAPAQETDETKAPGAPAAVQDAAKKALHFAEKL